MKHLKLLALTICLICMVSSPFLLTGCNSERIAAATAQILDFDDDIEGLERDIGQAKVVLQGVPLTDLRRAELESEVRVKTQELEKKQAAKGKLIKLREQEQAQDDAMYDEAGRIIQENTNMLPYGGTLGALGLLGLNLFRGWRKNKARDEVDAGRAVVYNAVKVEADEAKVEVTRQQKAAAAIVRSIQPLIDKATPEQLEVVEAVQSAVEGAKELVDLIQGKFDK